MTTYICPSENVWNGWITVYENNGRLFSTSFTTGLYWDYMEHLVRSKRCREEVGVTKEEVIETLNKIKAAWKEVAG